MKTNIVPKTAKADSPTPKRIAAWARRQTLARLEGLAVGRLTIVDSDGEHNFGPSKNDDEPRATIHVDHPRFYTSLALGGVNGAAEAYFAGHWRCDDLTALVRLIVRNRQILESTRRGWSWLRRPADQLFHILRRNTRLGSRENISAHYDLGNEFYSLFLDETMTYSSGVFARPDATLREAQVEKYDRLCRKLALTPHDHVLEIGTGWGGFALHAAGRYGCRVTTTTISRRQREVALARVTDAGLSDRVEVLFEDYRDLTGAYDQLVSIEMIEAVGCEHFDQFFGQCSRLLKPDGAMGVQAIVINDQDYDSARRRVDFIKRHIFPGGCLPSMAAMLASVARSGDLRLAHVDTFGPHYARTLAMWRQRLFDNAEAVKALGTSDAFLRLWEFYFCYCEGGFHERHIDVGQLVFHKPRCRRELPIAAASGEATP